MTSQASHNKGQANLQPMKIETCTVPLQFGEVLSTISS